MKPTILISNDSPQALLDSIGDDGRSRMKEGGGIIQFTSSDFRGSVVKKTEAKTKQPKRNVFNQII